MEELIDILEVLFDVKTTANGVEITTDKGVSLKIVVDDDVMAVAVFEDLVRVCESTDADAALEYIGELWGDETTVGNLSSVIDETENNFLTLAHSKEDFTDQLVADEINNLPSLSSGAIEQMLYYVNMEAYADEIFTNDYIAIDMPGGGIAVYVRG